MSAKDKLLNISFRLQDIVNSIDELYNFNIKIEDNPIKLSSDDCEWILNALEDYRQTLCSTRSWSSVEEIDKLITKLKGEENND